MVNSSQLLRSSMFLSCSNCEIIVMLSSAFPIFLAVSAKDKVSPGITSKAYPSAMSSSQRWSGLAWTVRFAT